MSTEREDAELIEEVAANWLAQREEGFSPAQAREFERWCRRDRRHAAAVAQLEEACRLLEKLPRIRSELQPVVEFPVARRPEVRPGRETRSAAWGRYIAAVAAVLTMAVLGWWQWPRAEAEPARYTTSVGGYERVLLADGSILELNANSEARVTLSKAERRVALRAGEAHFSVAPDPARPFIVEANGVAVRAVGTAFSVRLAAAAVEVLVTEGRVTVAKPESGGRKSEVGSNHSGSQAGVPVTELGVNERVIIPTAEVKRATAGVAPPAIEKVEPAVMRAALAWQERKLVFAETPLREVVAQFNRRNRLQLVVGDPVVAERPVGGTFAADNVEGFVRLLENSGAIAVERRSEFEMVLRQGR